MLKEKMNVAKSKILIGLAARTTNKNEMDPATAKIGSIVNSYWEKNIASKFNDRIHPGITVIAYAEYDSDENGEYTFFIGEEVGSAQDQDMSQFKQIVIPLGYYQKFTTRSGKLPDIVIQSWQKIWQMTNADFGGQRQYHTDFEIYDSRASDPANAVVDIYIGISND